MNLLGPIRGQFIFQIKLVLKSNFVCLSFGFRLESTRFNPKRWSELLSVLQILQSIVYVICQEVFLTITSLPWLLYIIYYVESIYGFTIPVSMPLGGLCRFYQHETFSSVSVRWCKLNRVLHTLTVVLQCLRRRTSNRDVTDSIPSQSVVTFRKCSAA